MTSQFQSPTQERLFEMVVQQLGEIGYKGDLLQRAYKFDDWFLPDNPEREAAVATFGQTPPAYDSACFAVVAANGKAGADLVNEYRALGAPRAFEVREDRIIHWRVSSATATTDEQQSIGPDQVSEVFRRNADAWKPESVLRAKNISAPGPRQLDFIDLGLIPALERHIRSKLDPLLREVLHAATKEYEYRARKSPNWSELYRLVFRSLTGKIMHDRGLPNFGSISGVPDAGDLLGKVAAFYNDQQPIIADPSTQKLVVDRLWRNVSFKNLSVEVLAFVWENTLVTKDVRDSLGIHATPPSVARYIVNRLPVQDIPQEQRRIVEPCCGCGTFLVAALQRLRELLPLSMPPRERHAYFVRMLAGIDIEPFGLEVARSCLMLADFPNPNGWVLAEEDVFNPPEQSPCFYDSLGKASVILCNPPFESFKPEDRLRYHLSSVHKPIEILERVISCLRPEGLLGFVLPRQLLNGAGYCGIRRRLAARYAEIELVNLPDKAFEKSEHETVLLVAKQPRTTRTTVSILHRKVEDQDWPSFNVYHSVSREDADRKSIGSAAGNLGIPDLQRVWEELAGLPTIRNATGAKVHRGIEWNIPLNENRAILISKTENSGFVPGIPSTRRSGFYSYQCPAIYYLRIDPEYRRGNAFDYPWDQPKVIMNAKRKSRSPWRIAAVADNAGLVCYQTFTCLWPSDNWTAKALAAVLNGPVANAFVAAREGNRDITVETVKEIPVPALTPGTIKEIDSLVAEYVASVERSVYDSQQVDSQGRPKAILTKIDMLLLAEYDLSAESERSLLHYFNGYGNKRPVPFNFGDYTTRAAPHATGSVESSAEVEPESESWEWLRKSLDEDRLSSRKLFP